MCIRDRLRGGRRGPGGHRVRERRGTPPSRRRPTLASAQAARHAHKQDGRDAQDRPDRRLLRGRGRGRPGPQQ
eukprot:13219192-Alexandrium_andersonii.AAC.1